MPSRMNEKKILIGFPEELYESIKKTSEKRYISVSSFIRQCVAERIEDELSAHDIELISQGMKDMEAGKIVGLDDL